MFENLVNSDALFLVAGPCSAESETQLRDTCEALMCSSSVSLLRCGVWKPRTRPGGFEGAGEEALKWISALKREHPSWHFATEVATAEHVELALRYGIDVLWLGARTTANPFLVAEIAGALRGMAVPVMVKNPVNPDVKLWMGAIERLQQVGLQDLAAVHRGFSRAAATISHEFRNDPLWEVPIELRRAMPQLPLLCDPSHLGGRREMIAMLSQTALNLDFDGLMVECHVHPEQALTDARQQLTPADLFAMLQGMKYLKRSGNVVGYIPKELTVLREQMNIVDDELLHLVEQRLAISQQIAAVKARNGMTIYQPRQWNRKLKHSLEKARELGLDESFVRELFVQLHMASIKRQNEPVHSPLPPKEGAN